MDSNIPSSGTRSTCCLQELCPSRWSFRQHAGGPRFPSEVMLVYPPLPRKTAASGKGETRGCEVWESRLSSIFLRCSLPSGARHIQVADLPRAPKATPRQHSVPHTHVWHSAAIQSSLNRILAFIHAAPVM